ncbi:MAG TPA: DUF5686 family protein [Bacteroidales bacterium]|nr:DUF5686 family protein [Bacteroidales bacterium]
MINKKAVLIILFVFLGIQLFSQTKFAGRIKDAKTSEPLAFVNIVYNSKNLGTTTDLDGYFTIESYDKIEFIKISYLGYNTKIITKDEFSGQNYIEIALEANTFYLEEVTVLPGVNPAHRIINEVISNADNNNPEKMRSFSYVSYNKMYFTIDMSMLPEEEDSISEVNANESDTSSDRQSMREFFDSQHIFITESVTERRFKYPDNNKEEVLAHRMSGLQNPGFTLLTTQFQSFSFYKDFISLMDKKYLSPISKGSTSKYFFQIEDTMYSESADTIFIISYRPLKGKNFEGLQGILHINSRGYAIQNVIAKPYNPTSAFNINIQQKYELIDSVQWFPVQLNTDIILDMFQVSEDSMTIPLVGVGKSYLSDISLNPEYKRKEFNQLDVIVNSDAHKKDSLFWELYRKEKLTEKDIKTYHVIDSIGKEANLDRTMEIVELIATGYIPWKFINFDPSSILWYNQYEGYRIGLGLSTNNKMLKWMSVGGYFAYGFRDKAWKYGGHLDFILNQSRSSVFRIGFKQDLEFSDDYTFNRDINIFANQTLRDFFLSELDSVTKYYASFKFSSLKYLHTDFRFNYTQKNIINPDRYDYLGSIPSSFYNSEFGIHFRYAYKEKFLQTPRGNRLSMGTNYPVLYLNVIRGLNFLEATNKYLKTEAMITKKIQWLHIGETHLSAVGGMVFGNVPYSYLYYGQASYSWINIDNSFNTMRINEFVSDRFASIFVRHDFGSLIFKTKKWAPTLALVTAVGWGDNTRLGDITEENFAQKMDKGYFESGIQLNNLLRLSFQGYGIGIYYRYGPYTRTKPIENWAFKFNLTFVL